MEFKNKWNLWYHHIKDDWTIDGYKNIYTIRNAEDFWKLYNNWDSIGGIISKHFFLMKNNVKPIWEDKENKYGGCWSFKIFDNQVSEMWQDLSTLLVTDELLNNGECLGLSICLKKNNNCVIKIWNKNSKNNSIKNINKMILEKWGTDIIYIAHMPEKLIV
jgi:translation initiation factor 4E